MKYRRCLLLVLIFVGIFLVLFQVFTITGAVVDVSRVLFRFWSIVGLGMIIIGVVMLVLERAVSVRPEHLYCYVPNECVSGGIVPGGSDPDEQVVPAFDPERFTPKLIREAFDIGGERSLVEIVGKSKKKFFPRLTGPKHEQNGIYGCEGYVPSKDLKVVGEDD